MSLKSDADAQDAASGPSIEGALLSATQLRWVKISIGIMTALLAIGIPVLIGRVVYLARYGSQGAPVPQTVAAEPALSATARLALPTGTQIKNVTLSGSRLAVHHIEDGGREEIIIMDMTKGTTLSKIEIVRGK